MSSLVETTSRRTTHFECVFLLCFYNSKLISLIWAFASHPKIMIHWSPINTNTKGTCQSVGIIGVSLLSGVTDTCFINTNTKADLFTATKHCFNCTVFVTSLTLLSGVTDTCFINTNTKADLFTATKHCFNCTVFVTSLTIILFKNDLLFLKLNDGLV